MRWRALLAVVVGLSLIGGSGALAEPASDLASTSAPIGRFEVAKVADGRIVVRGWALDPQTKKSIKVRVSVDGRERATIRAKKRRADVVKVYPGSGSRHGFSASVPTRGWGTKYVCVTALDVAGTVETELGCKLVHDIERSSLGKKRRLVIQGTGDVRADPWWYATDTGVDYSQAFAGMGSLFNDDDLTVINLECAASRLGSQVPKNFNFRCDPDSFGPFLDAGVDIASQANNHALDYGVAGMLDGIDQLWAAGLPEVGAGVDAADANEAVYVAVNGWRVAVLGFAGLVEFDWWIAGPGRPGLASGYSIPSMQDAIREADANADLVVVAVHWGRESVTRHNQWQTDRGRAMIDAGADIVFGHHPHRIQPVEEYGDGVIFYSLGNFVWPKLSAASADTAVGRVEIGAKGQRKWCLLDATITSHGRPTLDNPNRRSC